MTAKPKPFYKNTDSSLDPDAPFPGYSDHNIYPHHYEKKVITRTGLEVFMRPIKPEDSSLLLDLFDALSPRTRYYRFFSPLNVLPQDMLIRFTKIDYNRDMALVAIDLADTKEKILAVARFISIPDLSEAEFAVMVRDEWQGKGIGRVLLENLIMIAKEKKIESMSGYVLAENTHMLSLAGQLGFSLTRIPEENLYFLKVDLNPDCGTKKELRQKPEATSGAKGA